jgi:hypothetical protein
VTQAMNCISISMRGRRGRPKALAALLGMTGRILLILLCTVGGIRARAQDSLPDAPEQTSAGYVPVISGAFAYVQNTSGGIQSLEPQINPVLLVPIGHSLLLESHVDFTGFFNRENFTSGPFTGKVFKTIESAQLDWLADSHAIVVAGRYNLPFGLYSERLTPVWIHNLQDLPLTYGIGTSPDGSGNGFELRGTAATIKSADIRYTAYFSTHSSIVQLASVRETGGDASIFIPSKRLELGASYQRTLEGSQINNEAAYLTWQTQDASTDVKAEYDRNHFGDGYWIEVAHSPVHFPVAPEFFHRMQFVGRMEQSFVRNGGGHGLSNTERKRPEFGLNYQIRDDWRLESSYGRLFSQSGNSNTWNFGFTYRFIWPLWPGRKS